MSDFPHLPPPPEGYIRLKCMLCDQPCVALTESHEQAKRNGGIMITTCDRCESVVGMALKLMASATVRMQPAPDPEKDPALKAYIEAVKKTMKPKRN